MFKIPGGEGNDLRMNVFLSAWVSYFVGGVLGRAPPAPGEDFTPPLAASVGVNWTDRLAIDCFRELAAGAQLTLWIDPDAVDAVEHTRLTIHGGLMRRIDALRRAARVMDI